MDDLHKNNISADLLEKFHSSKNLNKDFEKEVEKRKIKCEKHASVLKAAEEAKKAPKEVSPQKPNFAGPRRA